MFANFHVKNSPTLAETPTDITEYCLGERHVHLAVMLSSKLLLRPLNDRASKSQV